MAVTGELRDFYIKKINRALGTDARSIVEAISRFISESLGEAGTGDMTKAVYDTDNDGVVDQAAALENGELVLTPKATAVGGAEGTIFYDSDDDHVYVATL